ncbi:MAG: DHH family phosphoesterase [Patescibacteria group bacterium]
MDHALEQLNEYFSGSRKILLITHRKPDGDALGSILSLLVYLRRQGKRAEGLVIDLWPSYFNFLPYVEELKSDFSLLDEPWDLVVVLDSGAWDYTGVRDLKGRGLKVVNMDHHFTNNKFGDLNLVDEKASSTCELVYKFFLAVGFKIDRQVATCLLCGILNDTSGFSNSATTAFAISAAAQLLKSGAQISKITENVFKNKSLEGLRLWGLILSRLAFNRRLELVYTYIQEEELKRYHVSEEEIDGFVNFLNSLSNVRGAIFFRINANNTKVSLRTTREDVDLSRLAGFFGGGGHKKAAGFHLPWALKEAAGRLIVKP